MSTNGAVRPMDVSFALAAVRRYAWVVLLGLAVGAVAAAVIGPWTTGLHQSRAVLAVRPSTGANIFFSEPEQYIDSQVIRLRSGAVVEAARQQLLAAGGPDLSTAEIERIVSIEPEPLTEIVAIVTTDDDPAVVRAVTKAYVAAYLASLPTTADDVERRAALTAEAAELTHELAALDEQIAAAMAPFLDADGDEGASVPTPEAVVPATVSRRQVVHTQLAQVDWALVELDRASRIQVNTTVLDDGSAPPRQLPLELNLTAFGALAAGGFVGLLGALLAGRVSSRVLDRRMAEELLGAPVVASIGHDESLAVGPVGALGQLASSTQQAIERVCTHAETAAQDGSLVVAVTSSRHPAGTSTLATAIAARFASWGRTVSLVDADGSDDDLVSVIAADAAATLVAPDLCVRALVRADRAPSAQLGDATDLVDAARAGGITVVVDCGPALGSAPARRVVELADVIVVALPRRAQERDGLNEVADILHRGGRPIVGVITTIAS